LNRLLIVCVALAVAACASNRPAGTPENAAQASKALPSGCVSQTATRIPLSPSECAAFGHVWTEQDVKRTGATDAAQALRLLDPTVTTGH
jgi:hypothetical protein